MGRRSLFLAVGILDRYLSQRQVARRQFQLVGACALLIAAKIEETEPPEVRDLVYFAAGEFNEGDVRRMERRMLHALDFVVTAPTVADFLPHFQVASQTLDSSDSKTMRPCMPALVPFVWKCEAPSKDQERRNEFSWRLAEMALLDERMARYPPSCLAASALLVSSRLFNLFPEWPEAAVELSGYSKASLAPCIDDLEDIHSASLHGSDSACALRGGGSGTRI